MVANRREYSTTAGELVVICGNINAFLIKCEWSANGTRMAANEHEWSTIAGQVF
jgi:hypothetical protein